MHPEYREVLQTYAKHQGMPVDEFGYDAETGRLDLADLERKIDNDTAAVIIQSPELFRHRRERQSRRRSGAQARRAAGFRVHRSRLARASRAAAPMPISSRANCSLSPSPPAYGGPYAGIIAAKEKFLRQMPGRLVGETVDSNGNRAFCLTLSTREQHIRREKATSNICTNQALIALMATVFMTVYGKEGLRELADAESGEGALPRLES